MFLDNILANSGSHLLMTDYKI